MSRKLRVVSLFANLSIGGDGNRVLAFARAVDRSRFDHSVLAITDPMDSTHRAFGTMWPLFQAHGVAVDSLCEPTRAQLRGSGPAPVRVLRDAWSMLRIVNRLRRWFIEQQVDVVDARMGYAVLLGALAARLAGVPVVVATEYGTDFWRGPLWGPLGQLAYALTDVMVSDSAPKVDQHQRWCLTRLKAEVIPNGIPQPQAQRSRAEMLAELRIPTDDPVLRVVAQVSRVMPSKGHGVLLEAARQVLAADPHVVFLICGYPHSPTYIDQLWAQAREAGIDDRLRIVSYPGPVADVWAAVDVHVHASLLDSAPIAIHESLALGLPSVVTRVGGIPAQVRENVTSLIVEPGDAAALAKAVLRVLREPELAQRLGQAARAHHEAHYRVETMTRAIENLFITQFEAKRHGGRSRALSHSAK